VGGSQGHAVVAANVDRQAAFLKKPFKYGESVAFFGRGESFADEKKTAGMIGDGQRIAVLTIPQQELTLIIGTPEFIGMLA
jgi:hypothetical protein